MTPAERLRAAANYIERTAARCNDGVDWYTAQELNVILGRDGAHVALWDPPTALLLVPLLRSEAEAAFVLELQAADSDLLALADAILTKAQGTPS